MKHEKVPVTIDLDLFVRAKDLIDAKFGRQILFKRADIARLVFIRFISPQIFESMENPLKETVLEIRSKS